MKFAASQKMLRLLLLMVPGFWCFGQFHEFFKVIKLSESTKAGSPVYYLDQILPSALPLEATIFSKNAAFSYKNGAIILDEKLDREKLCPFLDMKCSLTVKILLDQPDENSRRAQSLLTLQIEISDENDEKPTFQSDFSGATLNLCREALLNGMSGNVFLAADSDKDSQLRYGLKGAAFLSLEESNYVASDGASERDLSLRLNPSAAYAKSVHSVIVQVSDGIFQKEQSVLVHIDETCEEKYRFKKKVYRALVEENVSNHATGIILDSDALVDQVTFTFVDPTAREYLKIDDVTGEIYLLKDFDFEKKQKLRTAVELREVASESILDFAVVEILVRDVNDHPPKIQTTILPPAQLEENTVVVSESTPTGVGLAYFEIWDADVASAGQIDLRLNMGEEYFELRSGFLILKRNLDRETQNRVQVGLYACDNGRPKACSTELLNFLIQDENDHVPKFSICPQSVTVPEDAPPGKLITLVRANDGDHLNGDSSPFGRVQYFSQNPEITVNRESGRVFLNRELDREKEEYFKVSLIAQDGGVPPRKAVCVVKINVEDVNDNSPQFSNTPQVAKISSDSPANRVIHRFDIEDADKGENSVFDLKLEEHFDNLFSLSRDGILSLARNVTEFDKSEYTVRVIAKDLGGLSNTEEIKIEILPPELLQARSDPAILSGALAGLALVIIILIILVVIKCCRKREIYKFRSAEDTLGNCAAGDSRQTLSGWTVEINNTDCNTVKTGLIVEPTGSDQTEEFYMSKSDSNSKKTRSREDGGSEMVPDSGRGESEKDSLSSANQSQLGPHCTKDCLFSGHSDTCWMPAISRAGPADHSRADQELDTLNSSLIGYSKEKFSRLTQHYCNIKSQNTLAPSSDLQSQRSSGYLSSNEGGQQRSIHYC